MWLDAGEAVWRWFGALGLAALAGAHASLVMSARRATDGAAIVALIQTSIALAWFDAGAGILACSGAVDEVDGGIGQLMAVFVVLLLLTTVLPPILRRLRRAAGAAASFAPPTVAEQVLAAADRIEALGGLVRAAARVRAPAGDRARGSLTGSGRRQRSSASSSPAATAAAAPSSSTRPPTRASAPQTLITAAGRPPASRAAADTPHSAGSSSPREIA